MAKGPPGEDASSHLFSRLRAGHLLNPEPAALPQSFPGSPGPFRDSAPQRITPKHQAVWPGAQAGILLAPQIPSTTRSRAGWALGNSTTQSRLHRLGPVLPQLQLWSPGRPRRGPPEPLARGILGAVVHGALTRSRRLEGRRWGSHTSQRAPWRPLLGRGRCSSPALLGATSMPRCFA